MIMIVVIFIAIMKISDATDSRWVHELENSNRHVSIKNLNLILEQFQ